MAKSRQQRWAEKQRREGRCRTCGAPTPPSTRRGSKGFAAYCKEHRAANRERERKRVGCKRRLKSAESYQD